MPNTIWGQHLGSLIGDSYIEDEVLIRSKKVGNSSVDARSLSSSQSAIGETQPTLKYVYLELELL